MSRMVKVKVNFPKSLRKEIDKARVLTGESISGYILKAAYDRAFPMKDVKVISP